MSQAIPFNEILDAADQLSLEDQQALISILNHRVAEAGRQRVLAEVEEARQEFVAGQCKSATPDELMREIGA
jgi:hypothetical protein